MTWNITKVYSRPGFLDIYSFDDKNQDFKLGFCWDLYLISSDF